MPCFGIIVTTVLAAIYKYHKLMLTHVPFSFIIWVTAAGKVNASIVNQFQSWMTEKNSLPVQ